MGSTRYYSGQKENNSTYSRINRDPNRTSIDFNRYNLINSIDNAYDELLFETVSQADVHSIKECIYNGTYTFSPAYLYAITEDCQLIRSSSNDLKSNSDDYMLIKPIPEDMLVLTAIALLLQLHFISMDIQVPTSLGLRTSLDNYYDMIGSQRYIMKVNKIDIKFPILSIKRKRIYHKLCPYIVDPYMYKLIEQYIYLPIHDKDNNIVKLDYDNNNIVKLDYKDILPPISNLITDVITNYYLIDLDIEIESMFQRLFPNITYYRYMNEIIITLSTSCSMNKAAFDIFESKLINVLNSYGLSYKSFSIGCGDAPITSMYGGLQISLKHDGSIDVKKVDDQ